MTKIKIITDSTAGLTMEEMKQYNIEVLPLSVEVDGKSYNPMTDLTAEGFMELMANSQSLPKSSQPPIGSFVEAYEKFQQEGYEILSLHLTEKLSGTVLTARQAAEIAGGNITVIDTDYTARGQAFQVIEAAKMAQAGTFSMAEIVERIAEIRANTKLYIVVVTLENLIKGGRVGKMQGIIGNLLNIKLVARLKDGQLEEETKQRSMKKILNYLIDTVKNETKKVKELDIVHANGQKEAEQLAAEFKSLLSLKEVPMFKADPIISTHAGNGAFAFMYYTE
ncbi:DegV family protein [Listeria costaricensis]|uniref:DegV family protein n=1 Tax=Listeria costaricensis TaxID=2026604 RepID=UPI000C08C65C|nr:DegV family protein [Listeria costaricensis]